MEVIIDFQGFKNGDTFICKELAFASIDGTLLDHYMFETPPCIRCYSKDNAWLTENHHKLRWTDGDVPYYKIVDILQRIAGETYIFFVKGEEKKRWLTQFLPFHPKIDILTTLPSLRSSAYSFQPCCSYFHGCCALQNVIKLRNYINNGAYSNH